MTIETTRAALVSRDPEVHSGETVFSGTRVPVDTLVDYLEASHTLDEFLEHFPSVRREQAIGTLELLRAALLAE